MRQKILVFIVLLAVSAANAFVKNEEAESILDRARILFYEAVEDESKIEEAQNLFRKLQSFPEYEGRAVTYLGAIRALEGKHAFWVYSKFNHVKQGLSQMEEGLKLAPEDIESLFIYGSTCYYLPFLFARNDEAQSSFEQLSRLLPDHAQNYDPDLVLNVIDFLSDHGKLSDKKLEQLSAIKENLALK